MVNVGQQMRLATKLQRNLKQVFRDVDLLNVNRTINAVGDNLIEVVDASWATGDVYALIKFQEIPLSTFPVQGLPVHKVMICVETDAGGVGCKGNVGFIAEIIARVKDLGCAIEIYTSATTVKPADQATAAGTFGAGTDPLRYIRASVDTLGMGQ